MFLKEKFLVILILTYSFVCGAQVAEIDHLKYSAAKEITSSNAAVVSAHPLASKAGLSILKKGGNAVDAAIATQLALAVVYPGAGNIGGGGFLLARFNSGKTIALDYRETAPALASRDMYLDKDGNALLQLSQNGHLASGIPGTVSGLFASLKFAKLDVRTLIQPAIDLAEKGFALTAKQAASLNGHRLRFLNNNSSPVAFVKDDLWKEGDLLIQTELANTLKRIRDNGEKEFYQGETARLIVEEMKKGKGIISLEDLRNYKTRTRVPLKFSYRGYTILTMPLPSGGLLLNQMLKMIEPYNIAKSGFQTPESIQLMAEAERRAYADRAQFMADPDFVKVPVSELISGKYLKNRMADFKAGVAGNSMNTKAGNIPLSEETTHISITDSEGNAVSITTTLNGSYGSSTVIAGAGFLMNNEMDDFSVKPGVANMYGAVGSSQNAIAPNKRMLSSMTPTIVLNKNNLYMVVGTPGGTTIPTSVFQSIVNVIDFKLSPSDAVNKPKFHHQWLPDTVYIEANFPKDIAAKLTSMGYQVVTRDPIGRTELILVTGNGKNKKIIAVADKRGDDSAEGY